MLTGQVRDEVVMSIKNEIGLIVGKTISGVVVARNYWTPHAQIFLVFTDGTHHEIYGRLRPLGYEPKDYSPDDSERSAEN